MWGESEIGLGSAGLCFVSLMQARVIREEETSAEKMTQADVGKSVEHLD